MNGADWFYRVMAAVRVAAIIIAVIAFAVIARLS